MSSTNTSPAGIHRLSSLPSGVLEHIASYLLAPSRLIFAVAITERKKTPYQMIMARNPEHKESHSLIVGSWWNWLSLDFGDVEKELAEKLSDDDIKAILMSINAADGLLYLRLTNCTNITGSGLEPLRGSSKLCLLDLSLAAKHQRPVFYKYPALLLHRVIPILDSMIGVPRTNLMYLQLPHDWRRVCHGDIHFSDSIHAFIVRYKELALSRHLYCGKCFKRVWYENYDNVESDEYATEVSTCYDCMSCYCLDCRDEEDNSCMIFNCNACKKCFCNKCSTMNLCHCCWEIYCGACKAVTNHCDNCLSFCDDCKLKCKKCNRTSCRGCLQFGEEAISGYYCNICRRTLCVDCVPVQECAYLQCEKKICAECADKEGEEVVHRCIGVCCGDMLCNQHRLYELQQGITECEECIRFLSESFKGNDRLLEQVKYHKRHAGLEVDEGYCPCKWCSSRPQLRFKVGQLVSCRILMRRSPEDWKWVHGKVSRLWYQEPPWEEDDNWYPYQVQRDDGGGQIKVHLDSDEVIKALTKKRGRMDT